MESLSGEVVSYFFDRCLFFWFFLNYVSLVSLHVFFLFFGMVVIVMKTAFGVLSLVLDFC